jgi:hypothetical protein
MALVPVTAAATAYPARAARASSQTPPPGDGEPWTMPRRAWDVPHGPRPLDAIAAYREPHGPPPTLLDAYA